MILIILIKQFQNKTPIAHNSDKFVHNYYVHNESVSNTQNMEKVKFQRNSYWALKDMIEKEKRNVINEPPTEKELYKGIAEYVLKKQYENAQKKKLTPPHPIT